MGIASFTRATRVLAKLVRMMMTKAPRIGPDCVVCGASSVRAVRTRSIPAQKERVFYIAFMWTCSVCDNAWIDDTLERVNSHSAKAARDMASRRAMLQAS